MFYFKTYKIQTIMKHNLLWPSLLFIITLFCGCDKTDENRTLISMTINKIDLEAWALNTGMGNSWDENNGKPDIFLTVSSNTPTPSTEFITEVIENATNGTIYTFDNLNWRLSAPSSDYHVNLYDHDGANDFQYMKDIEFVPDNLNEENSSEIILSDASAVVKLYVTWEYE